jgi:site-specific DNA-methyltransferase (adenine-specific)
VKVKSNSVEVISIDLLKPQTNTIYRGDNLEIMRAMPDNCVDLIYIDPPFFTQKDYKNIWRDRESVLDYDDVSSLNGFSDTKDFFEKHIHSEAKGLGAYLEWMRYRLIEVHRVLKPTGTLYLHLDYHAVHYIKIMLDEIFGYKNFKNEVIWRRKTSRNTTKNPQKYPNASDNILIYAKSKDYFFDAQYEPNDPDYLTKFYRHDDENGRGRYRLDNAQSPSHSPTLIYDYKGYKPPKKGWVCKLSRMKQLDKEGRLHFPKSKDGRIAIKRFLNENKGKLLNNIWLDIPNVQNHSKENCGWPTQKPVALLERIIKTSSNEGDIVFDCFAGCGTSMHAAHNLKRKWIGIDISPTAIEVIFKRLEEIGAKVNVVDENELPVKLESRPNQNHNVTEGISER